MHYEDLMKLFRNLAVLSIAAFPILALDADLLKYGGPDAKEMAGVYLSRVAASPLGNFAQSKIGPDREEFAKFIADTGFDPRRDLVELIAFSQGGQGKKPGMVVARGRFDTARLGAALIAKGMTHGAYAGVETYEEKSRMIAFPEAGIGIAGDAAVVKAALDRRTQPANLDASIAEKVAAASRNDVWFVATGQKNVGFGKMKLPDDALEMVSGGLMLGSVVELTAEAVMKTEKDAQALAQVVQFLTAMGQLQGNQNPRMTPLFALLQNAKSTVQGSTVLFSLSAPEADVEKLLSKPNKRVASARAQ